MFTQKLKYLGTNQHVVDIREGIKFEQETTKK